MLKGAFAFGLILVLWLAPVGAQEPPPHPLGSFQTAKKKALRVIYAERTTTFYCGCSYTPNPTGTSGKIRSQECGYESRTGGVRSRKLEWEHVMPASTLWGTHSCWTEGHQLCMKDGTAYAGRDCCTKVDRAFKRAEADLHNLVPAIGEVNNDRGDKPYGEIRGEATDYGACDFEVDRDAGTAEPAEGLRGDVARIWFYMAETYDVELDEKMIDLLLGWAAGDSPDEWERERDSKIVAIQGNRNRYVTDSACNGESGFVSYPCE